jgi:putative membrane protein
MLIELILFLLAGVLAGTFSGLFPGIHINLIGIFMISLSTSYLSFLDPIYFAVFITAMAITHTFVDFIPSVFLGCPDTDTELSILPGHMLLKQGKGYAAVMLACYGNLIGIISLILLSFPLILLVSKTYSFLQTIMPYL